MVRYQIDNYIFDLSVGVFCALPKHYLTPVRKAVQASLKQLPKPVLSSQLKIRLPYQIGLSIVGPARMQKLNAQFRRKNKPTDVLSFSHLEGMQILEVCPEVGDIILCWSVAKDQAKEFGTSRKEELQRLTVHGLLHLFGYDHETNTKDARRMFRLQEKILASL